MASTSGSGWGSTPAIRARRSGGRRRRHGRHRHQPGGPHRGGRPRRPDPRVRRDKRAARRRDLPPDVTLRGPGCVPAQGPAGAGPPGPGRSSTGCRPSSRRRGRPTPSPNNLPTQLTTFVGRDAELAEAGDAARDDPAADADRAGRDGQDATVAPARGARLRTTSRTASSSCRSSPSATRCWSPPGSPAPSASSEAAPGRSPTRSPTGCATRRVLLVLDNFEQVVAAAPIVADLLRTRRPGSRSSSPAGPPCTCSGEQEYPVPGPARRRPIRAS